MCGRAIVHILKTLHLYNFELLENDKEMAEYLASIFGTEKDK